MASVQLELRFDPDARPSAGAEAWFLPGAGPAEWLAELSLWTVPLTGPILLPIPGAERAPCGVLVLASAPQRPSSRAEAYTRIGERLYMPVSARLSADVAVSELEVLSGVRLVLHPTAGLVSFARGDALALRDLLVAPFTSAARWNTAQEGAEALPPLRDVRPLRPLSIESIFAATRQDIGSEPPKPLLAEEAAAAEDGDATSGPARWAGRRMARVARWATGSEPNADTPSWIDRLERWAAEREQLRDRRSKELDRLLDLLERDPDLGLRYALPLTDAGTRGVAPPGATLPPRELRLDLGPRGGHAGDPWEIDPRVLAELHTRYRNAANRELALRRFRRAATIYLDLLGDVESAASALERGRHYREAALLYRARLGRPVDAARCLERGGLLLEAVELYRRERCYEPAAALLLRLGRTAEAQEVYRECVRDLIGDGDVRAAAHLLEAKVEAPDEALELLAGTWPYGAQAFGCLDDRFALLGRLDRHAEAARLVRVLDPAPTSRELAVVEALARVSGDYPDDGIRALARDRGRVVAGAALPTSSSAVAERLVRAVARLAPEDRLLARDARRFVSRVRQRRRGRRPGFSLRAIDWVRDLQLPRDVVWERAVGVDGGFVAAGIGSDGPVALRARWNGQTQWGRWPRQRVERDMLSPLMLSAPDDQGDLPVIVRGAHRALPLLRFEETDAFPRAMTLGTPTWLRSGVLAAAASPIGVVWAVSAVSTAPSTIVLTCHDAARSGDLLFTQRLSDWESSARAPTFHLLAEGRRLVIAWDRRVELRRGEELLEAIELPAPVTSLCASFRQESIGVSTAEGGVFLWGRRRRVQRHAFASGMASPLAGFTADGRLVALTRHEGRVYSTRDYGLQHLCTFTGPGDELVALLPVHTSEEEMAILSANGRVRLFRLPSE
jgi:tetratricopeptide (TPR) repeat protein